MASTSQSSKEKTLGEEFIFRRKRSGSPPLKLKNLTFIGDLSTGESAKIPRIKVDLCIGDKYKKKKRKDKFDLNAAYEKQKKKLEKEVKEEEKKKDQNLHDGNINSLLEYLEINSKNFPEHKSSENTVKLFPDFACLRGLLKKIMSFPEENWTFHATKFRGTIYLREIKPVEKMTDEQQKWSEWGFIFEQYMTKGADPMTDNKKTFQYYCILRSELGEHSLCYVAEMDGVDDSKYKPPYTDLSAFVELKTRNSNSNSNERRFIMNTTSIWWSQSFLVGTPKIICGFKKDGKVTELKTYEVEKLPTNAKNFISNEQLWSEDDMLLSLNDLLTYVKNKVTEDDPNLVYEFFIREKKPFHSTDPHISKVQCLRESSENSLLPKKYIDWVELQLKENSKGTKRPRTDSDCSRRVSHKSQ